MTSLLGLKSAYPFIAKFFSSILRHPDSSAREEPGILRPVLNETQGTDHPFGPLLGEPDLRPDVSNVDQLISLLDLLC